MKIQIRELDDPNSIAKKNVSGGVNIIDLANYNSCSFIETQDIGRIAENGQFEIMGRYDQSQIRGCNLLSIDS